MSIIPSFLEVLSYSKVPFKTVLPPGRNPHGKHKILTERGLLYRSKMQGREGTELMEGIN